MTLELIAPAKLNLVLEVTGRRPDGYHEIASLMQTIDIADTVRLEAADSLELNVGGETTAGVPREGPANLAFRAAQALALTAGQPNLGARIELEKRIPAGMGLGGGSTDAAAVLRGLNRLWGVDMDAAQLGEVAAAVGSDVSFFLHGGTAFASGRGEVVEPLPDIVPLELTLFVADVEIEDKTRRMYGLMSPADFTDGSRAKAARENARQGERLQETALYNGFDRHLEAVAPQVARGMDLCRSEGVPVWAAGSGPGFFCLTPPSKLPPLLLRELEHEWGVRAASTRTLGRDASTAVREV